MRQNQSSTLSSSFTVSEINSKNFYPSAAVNAENHTDSNNISNSNLNNKNTLNNKNIPAVRDEYLSVNQQSPGTSNLPAKLPVVKVSPVTNS